MTLQVLQAARDAVANDDKATALTLLDQLIGEWPGDTANADAGGGNGGPPPEGRGTQERGGGNGGPPPGG